MILCFVNGLIWGQYRTLFQFRFLKSVDCLYAQHLCGLLLAQPQTLRHSSEYNKDNIAGLGCQQDRGNIQWVGLCRLIVLLVLGHRGWECSVQWRACCNPLTRPRPASTLTQFWQKHFDMAATCRCHCPSASIYCRGPQTFRIYVPPGNFWHFFVPQVFVLYFNIYIIFSVCNFLRTPVWEPLIYCMSMAIISSDPTFKIMGDLQN